MSERRGITMRSVATILMAGFAFLYLGPSEHPASPLLLALIVLPYPLLACQPRKGWGRRAMVLWGVSSAIFGEGLDLYRWRYGENIPNAAYDLALLPLLATPIAGAVGYALARRSQTSEPEERHGLQSA